MVLPYARVQRATKKGQRMNEPIDLLIKGWYVVTMNATRDIIRDGAVAVRGSQIVDVGKAADLEARYDAARTVGGDRFVVTPGLVNTHIHITGGANSYWLRCGHA